MPNQLTTADPASAWVRRTPRQAAQASARFDREAQAAIAAHKAERTAEAIKTSVAKAIRLAEGVAVAMARNTFKGSPLTREQRKEFCAIEKDAWKTLRRYGSEYVTVLS